MKWEDHVVEKQALRDSRGRIIGGEGSDNRGAGDRVEEKEGEGFKGEGVSRGAGSPAPEVKGEGVATGGGRVKGGGASVDGAVRLAPSPACEKLLEFVERLVGLPTLTAQKVALAIIRGDDDNAAIAAKLKVSRWTVWRIRRHLKSDDFWRKFVRGRG